MVTQQRAIRGTKLIFIASALWLVLGAGKAVAGGLLLYEVGTSDVGLASAGWGARAQDASIPGAASYNSASALHYYNNGTASLKYKGTVSSFDADGLTMNWDTVDGSTYLYSFQAIGAAAGSGGGEGRQAYKSLYGYYY